MWHDNNWFSHRIPPIIPSLYAKQEDNSNHRLKDKGSLEKIQEIVIEILPLKHVHVPLL